MLVRYNLMMSVLSNGVGDILFEKETCQCLAQRILGLGTPWFSVIRRPCLLTWSSSRKEGFRSLGTRNASPNSSLLHHRNPSRKRMTMRRLLGPEPAYYLSMQPPSFFFMAPVFMSLPYSQHSNTKCVCVCRGPTSNSVTPAGCPMI